MQRKIKMQTSEQIVIRGHDMKACKYAHESYTVSEEVELIFAFAAINRITIAAWSEAAAKCKGVRPLRF